MYYASRNSKQKMVHSQQCQYGRRILPRNRICYADVRLAVADGFKMCHCCSPIYKRYAAEREHIEKFCQGKNINYSIDGDQMQIRTNAGEWILWCHPVSYEMQLFHKNHFRKFETAEHASSMFQGYHLQDVRRTSVTAYLNYIFHHDLYREKNPAVQQESVRRKKGKHRKERTAAAEDERRFRKAAGRKYSREQRGSWLDQEMEDWGMDLTATG